MKGRVYKVLAVVCPNGLGHFRRSVGILSRLVDLLPGLEIEVVCEAWQLERMRDFAPVQRLDRAGAQWRVGIMAPGVEWHGQGDRFEPGRLHSWFERLSGLDGLMTADLVLSDNLAGVLAARPDAVLIGSFLWSEVFRGLNARDEEMEKFCLWEERLLESARPPMLCVRDLAMPGLMARTSAVPLGWMSERLDSDSQALPFSGAVLVQGGAGEAGRSELSRACCALLDSGRWPVVVEKELAPECGGRRIDAVRGRSVAGGPLAVVCRPGMGTLGECVEAGVPIVAIHEAESPEMEHNARRVSELGIGESLASGFTPGEVVDAVSRLATAGAREQVRRRCAELDREGIEQAAKWLRARLTGEKPS